MLAIAQETATMGAFADVPIVHTPTITTLYALIETLQDQVVPEDDAAVTAAVVHLCKAGYAKFLNVLEDRGRDCTHETKPCHPLASGSMGRMQQGDCQFIAAMS